MGLEEIANAQDFVIYPNPAIDHITFCYPLFSSTANARLDLFSIDGKLLQTVKLKDITTHLSMGSLAPGLYIVKLTDNYDFILRKLMKK